MAHITEALDLIREEADGSARAGRTFEELVADAFRSHPAQWGKDRFREVWSWADWPGKEEYGLDGRDSGIDLVAAQTEAYGGGLCAIQCKLYTGEVPTKGVDSFLAFATESIFRDVLLVASAPVSANGNKKLDLRGGHVLYTTEMDPWIPDWREAVPRKTKVEVETPEAKTPRPDQEDALAAIRAGWEKGHRRGQLILPCGTGKTLTALWSAEKTTEPGDTILFLVPSLALMSQTMREWSANKTVPLQFLAVCSDLGVGKRGKDEGEVPLSELFAEVTTSPETISAALSAPVPAGFRRAVFCTYHSTPVLADALDEGFGFALAIFDEAHRTTGIDTDPEAVFQTALRDEKIYCERRLFMTATPRIFTQGQKDKIASGHYDGESYTMDDPDTYGEPFYWMTFAEAVKRGLLSDYKIHVVMVADPVHLAIADRTAFKWKDIAEDYRPRGRRGKDGKQADALLYNDALRLVGCWDALATPYSDGVEPDHVTGALNPELGEPLATALLYANNIKRSDSVAQTWAALARHEAKDKASPGREFLELGVNHMDGTTPAMARAEQLSRLRGASERRGEGKCEVISNVKVLTEGVDVPGLDAVIFLDPRASKVDVVQAVGRAMRRMAGKEEGHVIIPVLVGEGDDLEKSITKEGFDDVAEVIKALRAHDDRLNYWLSEPALAGKIIGGRVVGGTRGRGRAMKELEQMRLSLTEQVASVMVDKCGDRKMWLTWGERAGEATERVESRLRAEINRSKKATREFLNMCEDLEQIGIDATPAEVQQMIAHHIVTIPIFDAMFDKRFSRDNPVSKDMNGVLAALTEAGVSFDTDRADLERAYRRLRETLEAIEEASEGDPFHKADVIREIYDGFFARGMAKKVKKLGMVYTPQWIVDFMLRSVDAICQNHFGTPIDEGVRFLDPFAGTGIFPTRLLSAKGEDGEFLVSDERLEEVWENLYAGELVLLPYYAAALSTEEVYRRRRLLRDKADPGYESWPGLVLQDSLLAEGGQESFEGMSGNVARSQKLAGVAVDVVCTNPPWGKAEKKRAVAERVRETYGVKRVEAGGGSGGSPHGNRYVQAIRWATDRLLKEREDGEEERGKVLAMVHPNSLLEVKSAAGVRACLEEEFTDIYIVNLRGNANKQGEASRKEGQKIFGRGSKNGVQITVAVRDPRRVGQRAAVRVAEVPLYQGLDAKREWLEEQVGDVTSPLLETVAPRDDHWWGVPPDETWGKLVPLGGTGDEQIVGSRLDTEGIKTGADFLWVSRDPDTLAERMEEVLEEYEYYRRRAWDAGSKPSKQMVDNLCGRSKFARSHKMKDQLIRGREIVFDPAHIIPILYRPFVRRFLYADPDVLANVPVELRDWVAAEKRRRRGVGQDRMGSGDAPQSGAAITYGVGRETNK